MRWHPEPDHTTAWSAVGGVTTAVGVTSVLTLAFQPSSSHVPSLLVYACGVIAVVGVYGMVAPLAHWWPWSPHVATPIVLAITLGVVAAIISSGDDHSRHSRVATEPSAHSASNSALSSGTHGTSLPRSTAVSPASAANIAANGSSRAGMVTYRSTHFTAEIPAGWHAGEAEVPASEGVESTWHDPANRDDTLLIDASPATNRTLQQDAAPVQSKLLSEIGYQELYYGPGDLHGVDSWMWVWRISGRQRIDYFFDRCSTDFGVLGSSVPGRFSYLRARFRLVAQSVQANCH